MSNFKFWSLSPALRDADGFFDRINKINMKGYEEATFAHRVREMYYACVFSQSCLSCKSCPISI